jgi:hypothetical protein
MFFFFSCDFRFADYYYIVAGRRWRRGGRGE